MAEEAHRAREAEAIAGIADVTMRQRDSATLIRSNRSLIGAGVVNASDFEPEPTGTPRLSPRKRRAADNVDADDDGWVSRHLDTSGGESLGRRASRMCAYDMVPLALLATRRAAVIDATIDIARAVGGVPEDVLASLAVLRDRVTSARPPLNMASPSRAQSSAGSLLEFGALAASPSAGRSRRLYPVDPPSSP